MKICHITDFLPQLHRKSGGAETVVFNLMDLIKDRTESVILTTTLRTRPAENYKDYKIFGLKISEDIIGWKLSFIKRLLQFDLLVYFQALKILKKEKPDVVHFHNFLNLSFSIIFAAKRLKIPIILSIYDYWHICPKRTILDQNKKICRRYHGRYCLECRQSNFLPLSERLSYYYRRKLFNFYLKKIDSFIVLSFSSREIMIDYGIPKEKIAIIPFYVKKFEEEIITVENQSVLFAGWLTPTKGVDRILAAWPLVLAEFPQAKLVILGMKPDKNYLEKLIKIINDNFLAEKIIFIPGAIDKKEFDKYFSKSVILVIPEQWPNMSPVIMAEAMAAKKVILASNIGGITEFIESEKNGFLVDPYQPHEWAKKIIDVFKMDKEKIEKIRNEAYQSYLQNFNGLKTKKLMIDLYESFRKE